MLTPPCTSRCLVVRPHLIDLQPQGASPILLQTANHVRGFRLQPPYGIERISVEQNQRVIAWTTLSTASTRSWPKACNPAGALRARNRRLVRHDRAHHEPIKMPARAGIVMWLFGIGYRFRYVFAGGFFIFSTAVIDRSFWEAWDPLPFGIDEGIPVPPASGTELTVVPTNLSLSARLVRRRIHPEYLQGILRVTAHV